MDPHLLVGKSGDAQVGVLLTLLRVDSGLESSRRIGAVVDDVALLPDGALLAHEVDDDFELDDDDFELDDDDEFEDDYDDEDLEGLEEIGDFDDDADFDDFDDDY